MNTLVEQVEKLLEAGETEAVTQLLLKEQSESDKELREYCWGRYYNVTENFGEALKHLNSAKEILCNDIGLYRELGFTNNKLGNVNDAEQAYLKMYDLEKNPKYKWAIMSVLADFYKEHHMFLKMEKVGKKLCQEYRTNYRGYHVLAMAKLERKQYRECELILEKVPKGLRLLPQYIDDFISCYEVQNKYEQILLLLEQNKQFSEKYRNYTLKKQIMAYSSLEKYEEAENCLLNLVFEFGEMDAILSLAILLISKQEYEKAIALGNLVQTNIDEGEIIYEYYAKLINVVGKYMKCMDSKEKAECESVCSAIDGLIVYLKKKNLLAYKIEIELIKMKTNLQSCKETKEQ